MEGEIPTPAQQKVTAVYVKNSDYRTVFATSIYGGATPNGLVSLSFAIDRQSLPATSVSVVRETSIEGQSELKEINKTLMEAPPGTFVREMQVGVVMDVLTAKNTIIWLEDQVKNIEAQLNK